MPEMTDNRDKRPYLRLGAAVMASGAGSRFGSNKLLADAGGRTVIQRTLDCIDTELFDGRDVCVVTRYPEIAEEAGSRGLRSVLHGFPFKSDTVRLATEALAECDGIMYFQADQFLLSRSSIAGLTDAFADDPEHPVRLCTGGRPGSPVIFPKSYYPALMSLEGDSGGGGLLREAKVNTTEAENAYELMDADTPEELEEMVEILHSVQVTVGSQCNR